MVDSTTTTSAGPLARLLNPRSVSVIGVSSDPTSLSAWLLRRTVAADYRGELTVVKPGVTEVNGVRAVASLTDLDAAPDVAVMMRSTRHALGELERCVDIGVPYVLLFNALASDYETFNAAARAVVAGSDTRLLGPNTMGFVNFADSVSITFSAPVIPAPLPGFEHVPGVAIIGHSGGVCLSTAAEVSAMGGRISHFVSLGNEADLQAHDFVEHFAHDPEVRVVVAYLEQIRNPDRFLRAAHALHSRGGHLVVMRTGLSRTGQQLAMSHTGAVVGAFEHENGFLRDVGALVVAGTQQAGQLAASLAALRSEGDGLSIVTLSGGLSGIMADSAERNGVDLPPIGEATASMLRRELGASGIIAADVVNPVDLGAPGLHDDELWLSTVELELARPEIGAVLALTSDNIATRMEPARKLAEAADTTLALLAFKKDVEPFRDVLRRGVPVFVDEDEAVRTLGAALAARRHVTRAPQPRGASVPPPADLDEIGLKSWLRGVGVASPRGVHLGPHPSPDEIGGVLSELDFPVVVKAVAPGLLHKSEVGGVALAVASPSDVVREIADMGRRLAGHGITPTRYLVEEMVPNVGVEWFVGVTNDGRFGPAVTVGVGGVAIEALAHARTRPCPLDPAEAALLLGSLPAWRTLEGRGLISANGARAMAALVAAVSVLAHAAGDWMAELDLNPVVVHGDRAVALDAAVRCAVSDAISVAAD